MSPGRICERDAGLINFGDGTVTYFSNDGIRGIDQIGVKIGRIFRQKNQIVLVFFRITGARSDKMAIGLIFEFIDKLPIE